MKGKPNHFTQGRATGPTGKPDKNMVIHWDYLAKRDKAPLRTTFKKFVQATGCRRVVCAFLDVSVVGICVITC